MNLIVAIMLFFATACTPEDKPLTPSPTTVGDITITIGDQIFTAKMEQNSTVEAFRALLPLTLEMQELNGNEKYHYLSQSLPTNRTKVGTIHAGDIMLYGDNCVVVFTRPSQPPTNTPPSATSPTLKVSKKPSEAAQQPSILQNNNSKRFH